MEGKSNTNKIKLSGVGNEGPATKISLSFNQKVEDEMDEFGMPKRKISKGDGSQSSKKKQPTKQVTTSGGKSKMQSKKKMMSDEKQRPEGTSTLEESPDDQTKKSKKRYQKGKGESAGGENKSFKTQISGLSALSGEKPQKRMKTQSGDNISDSGDRDNLEESKGVSSNNLTSQFEETKQVKDSQQQKQEIQERKDNFSKKPVKKWEKRWVLQPNVIEYGNDIWICKWVCVDSLNTVNIGEQAKVGVQYYEKVNGLSSFPINETIVKEGQEQANKTLINQHQQDEMTLQEHIQYEKAAQQTLDYFTPLQNAELDLESLSKKYVCQEEDCGKVFFDQGSYRKHQMTHGERMYICKVPTCGKKFLDNSKLKRHQLVHTGEKPYKCDICNKKFSLDFNLRTHLRTHTGEKPYVCSFPGCNKRFTQSSNLTAHERTHSMRDSNGQLIPSGQMIDEDGNIQMYGEGEYDEGMINEMQGNYMMQQQQQQLFQTEKLNGQGMSNQNIFEVQQQFQNRPYPERQHYAQLDDEEEQGLDEECEDQMLNPKYHHTDMY
ncbi:transcriptional repressor protein yy1-like [Stylonychia lemnae]|uniref:Transcriptional repressor protein yy1-like n=1 Tax=Stylonychia lemnae TaxID=5949 RepID=A0A078A154_STYLE|nr:transcriptional repressor protein yy1-like [Stylonychia lemnae]|eukprot:CDW75976.1 transcriptional repressor protein yy1-like [Stylonychia lemnae]